ncbi:putative ubiquitin carboxyl-terminal hydrolase protein [Neofusicoccum parvum UCRNP2]|uniref:Ubiquitin carboxyl-terminal hydrolase n=3 Tax=Neofusicoccum TaxID=407951 RepID=R1GA62_BOTPV|nr:putative ubiquitin carboxyl-terminal hydrolase protein [Neofusicoccum parvum UCRNP2]GME22059.1 ubiquitin carboxyl-terminal hydrolase [Neofusicoccum parvum]
MDTITVTPKSAGPPANAKITKGKLLTGTSNLPQILYGCEHLEPLFAERRKVLVQQYTTIIQTIHDRHSIIPQTHRSSLNGDSRPVLSLKPTYMCLQCVGVFTAELRDEHFEAKKHAFSVESKQGCVYCQQCKDFIYDPMLENVRLLNGRKKRKLEETMTPDDHRLVAQNSTFAPCRAIGLRGLYNMGQTCFMSVILQCLIHNPFIKAFYLGEGHTSKDCDRESCTSCALDEIFTEYYSLEKTEGYGAVSMLLGSWSGAQALAGYQQQDAHEYMQFILNNLHLENDGTESGPGKDGEGDCSCLIHKTFSGKLQSTVTCDKCRNVTTAIDPVMDLSLDLRSQAKKRKLEGDAEKNPAIDLRDCLDRFTGKEKLAAADYSCEKCGGTQQNATKQLSIKKLPPVLPIHLKRFETSKSTSTKLETKIAFPMSLDLYPYTTRARTTNTSSKDSSANGTKESKALPTPTCMYELASVIVHKGKIDSGHYVSYSRKGGDWFLFDDSKVVLASEADVLRAEAYLLVYVVRSLEG